MLRVALVVAFGAEQTGGHSSGWADLGEVTLPRLSGNRSADMPSAMLWEWILEWWSRATGEVADIGAKGERAAADHLRREKGFVIVQRNWRHGRDEIDLVCRDGEILVFVEVKTRAAHALVAGRAAVDRRKKRALSRACRSYLAQLETKPRTFRFDIVEAEHREGAVTAVRHFANVPLFAPLYRPGE